MIRINYGTPWDGDLGCLKEFFPDWYHNKLILGGLTEVIEALSPFADEPTDPGLITDEPTLLDGDSTELLATEDPAKLSEYTVTIF